MSATEAKSGIPGSTGAASGVEAAAALAKKALEGLDAAASRTEQPKEEKVTIQGRRKHEKEKTAKKPKTEFGEKPTDKTKTPVQEELDTKLDEAAEKQLGQGKRFTDATTISNKVAILRKTLEEQAKVEGTTDEHNKVLLEHFQKIERLCEHQEQKVFQQTEWEQAQAELKGIQKEQLGETQRFILERTHQEVFADVIEHPQDYGITSQEQAREAAKTLVYAKLSQYRQEHGIGPADPIVDVPESGRIIVMEKEFDEYERKPIEQKLQKNIDELTSPQGLAIKAQLEDLRDLLKEPSTPEQWQKIQAVYRAMPKEAYHFKNDPTLNRIKVEVYNHLSQGQNIQDYGLHSLLTKEELKQWESNPQAQVDLIRVKLADQVHEFYLGRAAPPPGKSGFYIDQAQVDALPETTLDEKLYKQFLRDVNVALGDEAQTTLDPDSRKNGAYYTKVADLMYTYTTEYMNERFAVDVDFQSQMLHLVGEGAKAIDMANDRGWSDLYLSVRNMKLAHENLEYVLIKLEDQIREVPSFFENDVKRAFGYLKGQVAKYAANTDYRAGRISYMTNEANHPRIELLSGIPFDPDNPMSHPWVAEVVDNELFQVFLTRVNHMTSDSESLQYSYTNLLAGGDLQRGQSAIANLSEAGVCRIYTGRGGINSYVNSTIARHGWNIKWEMRDGQRRVIAGAAFKEMIEEATNEIWTHKRFIEKDFEKFAHRNLKIRDVRAAVREAFMLKAVTGERAEYVLNGLLPTEINGGHPEDLIDPAAYAGQLPDYSWMKALDAVRSVDFRWSMVEDAVAVRYRTMAYNEAAGSYMDLEINDYMKDVLEGSPEFVERAMRAFNIVRVEPGIRGERVIRAALENIHALRCGEASQKPIPTSLDGKADSNGKATIGLSKKDLTNWMIFKQGLDLAGKRLTGGYTTNSAGWNNETLVNISHNAKFKDLFGGTLQKSFAHERLRVTAGDLITAPTESAIEDVQHRMTAPHLSGDLEGEGMLVTLGKVDPVNICQALEEVQNPEFKKYFAQHAGAGEYDIFMDKVLKPDGSYAYVASRQGITSDRFDRFVKRFSKPRQIADQMLAKARKGPMDYSVGLVAAQASDKWDIFKDVCTEVGVNPEDFYNKMHDISAFVLQENILKRAASPLVAKYWMTVHYKDPRFMYVDAKEYKGEHWSTLISHDDPSTASGLGRMYGDCNTANESYKPFNVAMYTFDEKTFHDAANQYVNTIKFAGGRNCKIMATQMLYYSWGLPGLMDLKFDLAGVDGHDATFPTSSAQRAGGQAEPSMRRNQFEEFIHHGEGITNTVWHHWSPHVTEMIEERNKLVVTVLGWPKFVENLADRSNSNLVKKIFHTKLKAKAINLYRGAGFGALAGGLLAIGAFGQLQKGISGDDSDDK